MLGQFCYQTSLSKSNLKQQPEIKNVTLTTKVSCYLSLLPGNITSIFWLEILKLWIQLKVATRCLCWTSWWTWKSAVITRISSPQLPTWVNRRALHYHCSCQEKCNRLACCVLYLIKFISYVFLWPCEFYSDGLSDMVKVFCDIC